MQPIMAKKEYPPKFEIANGFVTLTASVTLSCQTSPIPSLTRSINVGDVTTTAQLLGSDCIQQINEMYSMFTANPCNNCTYQWTLLKLGNGNSTSSSASITSQIENTCWIYGTASGGSNAWASYSIGCTINNACAGTSTTIWHPFKVTPRGGSACNSSSFAAASSTEFKISPNPSSELIVIEANTEAVTKSIALPNIQDVELIDRTGALKYKKKFGKGLSRVSILVGNLPTDMYILRVFNGDVWQSYKVSINH
jgi:hypothetical protein